VYDTYSCVKNVNQLVSTLVPRKDLILVRPNYSNTCKGLCGSHFHWK